MHDHELISWLVNQITAAQDRLYKEGKCDIYGAARIGDLKPAVPSVIRNCQECNAEVWIDEKRIEAAEDLGIMCLQCIQAASIKHASEKEGV